MTVSQKINAVTPEQNAYDDDITVTDVPPQQFLAVVQNNPPAAGDTTRHMVVELMDLEQAPGGTRTINSGLYIRQDGETAVKVTVQRQGQQLAENTTNY